MPGVDDRHRPLVAVERASEEPRDLLERPLRGGQPDPLRRHVAELLEPLQGQGEMRAALGGRHRVDLVDDHGPHAPERLASGRGEHQVERLRRGDQDVGRAPDQPLPIARGRVAAADRDHRRVGERRPEPVGRVLDPGERGAEVLLDVDRERSQRRHVEHPCPRGGILGRRLGGEPVDRPQERGERLPRPGGGEDQRMVAGGDRLPPVALGARGRLERGPEPIADGGREDLEAHVPQPTGCSRHAGGRR